MKREKRKKVGSSRKSWALSEQVIHTTFYLPSQDTKVDATSLSWERFFLSFFRPSFLSFVLSFSLSFILSRSLILFHGENRSISKTRDTSLALSLVFFPLQKQKEKTFSYISISTVHWPYHRLLYLGQFVRCFWSSFFFSSSPPFLSPSLSLSLNTPTTLVIFFFFFIFLFFFLLMGVLCCFFSLLVSTLR